MDADLLQCNISAHAENNIVFAPPVPRPLPIVVVTGFLGSGKTTLVEKLHSSRANLHIATIAHDLAPNVNVDAELLATAASKSLRRAEAALVDGDVLGLGGCACCPDFDEALRRAVRSSLKEGVDKGTLDYLVLETSGAADPRRLVATLEQRFGPCTRARLDHVVTVVDAERAAEAGQAWLAAPGERDPEARVQLAQLLAADIILLNKVDLIGADARAAAEARLRQLCPQTRIFSCEYGQVPITDLLEVIPASAGVATVSHEAALAQTVLSVPQCLEPQQRNAPAFDESVSVLPPLGSSHTAGHRVLEWSSVEGEGVPLARLQHFLSRELPKWQRSLRRGKGVLWVPEDASARWEWQLSGRLRYAIRRHVGDSFVSAQRSFLVLIFAPGFPDSEFARVQASAAALTQPVSQEEESLRAAQTAYAEAVSEITAADEPPGFELLDAPDSNGGGGLGRGAGPVVRFRLTGRAHFKIPEEVDVTAHPYSIDLDALNAELARLVSASKGALFLATGTAGDPRSGGVPVTALLWAVDVPGVAAAASAKAGDAEPPAPPAQFSAMLAAARAEALPLLKRTFSHVHSCYCGQ